MYERLEEEEKDVNNQLSIIFSDLAKEIIELSKDVKDISSAIELHLQIMATITSMFRILHDFTGISFKDQSLAHNYIIALEERDHSYMRGVVKYIVDELNISEKAEDHVIFFKAFMFDKSPYIKIDIPDDANEGVFQMKSFTYKTYEEWISVYRQSVYEAEASLKIGESEHTLLDLMDDAPLRKAFRYHLDPKPLGAHAGNTFDISKTQFEDGTTHEEFICELEEENNKNNLTEYAISEEKIFKILGFTLPQIITGVALIYMFSLL